MARVVINGFETASTADTVTTGNLPALGARFTFVTDVVRSGAYALRVDAQSGSSTGASFQVGSLSTTSQRYGRVYIRVPSFPNPSRTFVGNTINANLRILANGTIQYYSGTTLIGTSTTALTTDQWHCIEWRNGGTGVVLLRIDGNDEVTGNGNANFVGLIGATSTEANTPTIYFDDYAEDDATWPGEGRVALLLPVSDNSVGTGWQKPGGSTTNLYTSVDNVPPNGVANSTNAAQAENQIRNAVSNNATDVVFNMESYIKTLSGTVISVDGSSGVTLGTNGNRLAQSFLAEQSSISDILLSLSRSGSPVDDLVVELRSDNAGNPGTLLTSKNLSAGSFLLNVSSEVATGISTSGLTIGALYWIVAYRSGSTDGSNLARWHYRDTNPYPNGSARSSTNSGSSWGVHKSSDRDMSSRILAPGQSAADPTINATQAFAIVGLATTATTKTGSLEVRSNPAVAEVNFGAYGTGTAVGTFPTGWQRRSHTIVNNPTVSMVPSDQPVVELGQRTANTTIAQCCFVGMYVDYTPAAAALATADMPSYIGGGYYG